MCDPVTLAVLAASTAMSAGGSFLNNKEETANQNRALEARKNAAEVERIRQKKFEDETTPLFTSELTNLSPDAQNAALATAQQERTGKTQAAVTTANEYAAPASGAPQVVNSEIGRRVGQALRGQTAEAGNLAKLNAWQDLDFANRLGLNATNRNLGTLNNFSANSLQLLPYEQEVAARNAYKPPSGFGDLLKLGGSALGLASGVGAFGGGAGADAIPTGVGYVGKVAPLRLSGLPGMGRIF